MAMSVRERTSELAVLKALGYSDRFVLSLVPIETLVIATLGGGTGLLLAKLFTLSGNPTAGVLPVFYLSGGGLALGALSIVLVGLAAGLLPALTARRLQVVDALRRL
jgi:putative ABC transport system permease protein